ncbi:MAG: endolytic transglycosylase MltG, partial [Atribacterota bacterium]|nr:endolytic transglycosylase MltG [Atribacterota bacterium]MDD4896725.1 endolytic transglycosylase MltG [Atribacterota bacterium]MDD5637926.1 endolytic transglycosylase MltG [Atribacterota bacterium]
MKIIVNRFFNLLFFLFSVGFLVLILSAAWIFLPIKIDEPIEKIIEIPYGYNSTQIRQLLEEEGVIRPHNYLFQVITKFMKTDALLQSGEYRFSSAQNLVQIIEQLIRGRVMLYRITIPEGFQAKQIARLLADREIVDYEVFLKFIKEENQYREGYLFPDTYEFPKNIGAENVLKLMQKNFEDVVYKHINPEQNFPAGLSFHQIIILASIIEKEAQGTEDKPRIASVFYNRLSEGMFLQSCATIQYLLDKPQERLTQQDLTIESPFNTYLYPGLPPKPICNPGLESILAAVHPTEEDYFYFVLGKDGKHVFSRTYQEHLDNKP